MGPGVEPRPHSAAPMLPRRYRVAAKQRETEDTWTLSMDAVDGEVLEFLPGQFNMMYAFGAGEVPVSVSGDPGRPERLVHTVRAVGATTNAICAADSGQMLGVRGPFGSAWPLEGAAGADVLVVAGGVGLAPLRPVVYSLVASPERYRRMILLYGGRSPEQLLFRGEIDRWREGSDLDVGVTVDIASGEWTGSVGVVPRLLERVRFDPSRAVAFVCGPEAMMRFTATALLDRGVDAGSIYLSIERNMKCAVGQCGHCQFGPEFVCRDGPVFSLQRLGRFFDIREL